MKYCRYGFSVISATRSLSENPNFFWIRSEPNAILSGFAGIPVLLGKSSAYLSSISFYGMVSDFFTHLFSGSSFIPIGWSKSVIQYWRFLSFLYMTLSCQMQGFFIFLCIFPALTVYHISPQKSAFSMSLDGCIGV